jgi:hypothetical protein
MLIFGQPHLRTVLAEYETHTTGGAPIAAASSARPGPATLSPTFPGTDPASADPRRLHQRVRAGRIESQLSTSGRVLEPRRVGLVAATL